MMSAAQRIDYYEEISKMKFKVFLLFSFFLLNSYSQVTSIDFCQNLIDSKKKTNKKKTHILKEIRLVANLVFTPQNLVNINSILPLNKTMHSIKQTGHALIAIPEVVISDDELKKLRKLKRAVRKKSRKFKKTWFFKELINIETVQKCENLIKENQNKFENLQKISRSIDRLQELKKIKNDSVVNLLE